MSVVATWIEIEVGSGGTHDPRAREAEAGGSPNSRPAWSINEFQKGQTTQRSLVLKTKKKEKGHRVYCAKLNKLKTLESVRQRPLVLT